MAKGVGMNLEPDDGASADISDEVKKRAIEWVSGDWGCQWWACDDIDDPYYANKDTSLAAATSTAFGFWIVLQQSE